VVRERYLVSLHIAPEVKHVVLPWREIAQEGKASASRWLTLELGQQTNPLLHPVDKSPLTRSNIRKLKFPRCQQDTVEKHLLRTSSTKSTEDCTHSKRESTKITLLPKV
jgi:hypothetical protein